MQLEKTRAFRYSIVMTRKKNSFRHVTIVGVGLLGGSIALGLRRAYPGVRIAGVGRRQISLDAALAVGAIDTGHLDVAECVGLSDLVILATPVCAFEGYLRTIEPLLRRGALVTDVGSTKAEVVRIAERVLGKGGPFVGSHPMAGNEKKGPEHADADLVRDALCIVTPTQHTPAARATRIEKLWRDLGMRTTKLLPAAHDRAVARVSHLPHVLAALQMELPRDQELELSSTGLLSATRLASGDPEMWRDIMTTNRRAILTAIDQFSRSLEKVRTMLDAEAGPDAQALERFFTRAKLRRDSTIAADSAAPSSREWAKGE